MAAWASFVGFKTAVCQSPKEAGAGNGRIYAARGPRIHVPLSSPSVGSAHAVGECLDSSSLDAYHQLCYETAPMTID